MLRGSHFNQFSFLGGAIITILQFVEMLISYEQRENQGGWMNGSLGILM